MPRSLKKRASFLPLAATVCGCVLFFGAVLSRPGSAFAGTSEVPAWYRLRVSGVPYRPQHITADPFGGLWMTAVTEYAPGVWRFLPETPVNPIEYITNQRHNNLVAPEYLTLIEKPQLSAKVLYVVRDKEGTVWYALENRTVLCEKTDGTFLPFNMPDSTDLNPYVDTTNVDSAHRIRLIDRQDGTQDKLLIASRGVVRVDSQFAVVETRKVYTTYNNDLIRDVLIDTQGRYWVTSERGLEKGTSLVNTTYVKDEYAADPSAPGADTVINRMQEDFQGNIWFVSDSYASDGIYCFTAGAEWRKYTDGVVADIGKKVHAIAGAPDGSVWFGGALSQAGGLLRFMPDGDGGQWFRYGGTDLGVFSEEVSSLVWGNGGLWFVTSYDPSVSGNGTGLHFLTMSQDGQLNVEHYTYRSSTATLTNHRFDAIAADRSGGVWFPAYDDPSIARLRADGTWQQFRGNMGGKSLGSYGISGVAVDSTNKVYFAPVNCQPVAYDVMAGEVLNLPEAPYTHFYYYGVYVDPDDGKWFHGAFGVYYLDKQNSAWTRYSTAEVPELPDNYVSDVLVDDAGNAWLMCRYGIALMRRDTGGTATWKKFEQGDESGYLNSSYASHNVYLDDSGNIWNNARQKFEPSTDTWESVSDTSPLDERHLRFLNGRVPVNMDLSQALSPVESANQAVMTLDAKGNLYFCGGLGNVNAGIVVHTPPPGVVDLEGVDLASVVTALKIMAGMEVESFSPIWGTDGNNKVGIDKIIYILQKLSCIR